MRVHSAISEHIALARHGQVRRYAARPRQADMATQRPAHDRTKAKPEDKGPRSTPYALHTTPNAHSHNAKPCKIRQTIVYLTRECNIFPIRIINFPIFCHITLISILRLIKPQSQSRLTRLAGFSRTSPQQETNVSGTCTPRQNRNQRQDEHGLFTGMRAMRKVQVDGILRLSGAGTI
jgi:hypothetical protein